MTVCLAATCDHGSGVIVASDRMVTSFAWSIEFEHPSSKKITPLDHKVVAMISGDALAYTELFWNVGRELADRPSASARIIVDTIAAAYQKARLKAVEDRVLRSRGINGIGDWYAMQAQLKDNVVFTIQNDIDTYNYGLDILVAGLGDSRAHLFSVHNPGTSLCWDSVNFHAIGSGAGHAVTSLITRECHENLDRSRVLMKVIDAKRVAEKSPGVGNRTDVTLLDKDGRREVSQNQVDALIAINDKWRNRDSAWRAETETILAELEPVTDTMDTGDSDVTPETQR